MNNTTILLIGRGLKKTMLQPAGALGGLGMSLFFLLVYNAGIGGVGSLDAFGGGGYFAFLFPLAIVSLAMGSSSGAGQILHNDMQNRYFERLYFSPAPRWAFAAAPVIVDAVCTAAMTSLLLVIGLIFSLPLRFGAVSFFGIVGLSLLWGVILSGLAAGVMLRTRNHQSAQLVITAIFPLIFLSTTFMPRELISSEWLLAVSWANPVTYLLEAMRYLLSGTSSVEFFLAAIAMLFAAAVGALVFAVRSTRRLVG
jgi:ABC-2 type transport system permease protein